MSDNTPGHDCDWCDERLEPWLDGDLPADEASALEGHVAECRHCTRQISLARRIRSELRDLEQPACPEGVASALAGHTRPRRLRLAPALAAGLMAGAVGLGIVWQMTGTTETVEPPSRVELAEARADLGVALGYISAAGRVAGRDVGNVLAGEGLMRPIQRGLDLEITIPALRRESPDMVESET
jgi:anti-sigma factor (TIGR02949 family)